MASKPRTLYEKIWDAHVVETRDDGTSLIYIDRHLVHEVTSPQAFEALRMAGRKVRRPDLTLAMPDHNLPTTARRDSAGARIPIADPESAQQLAALVGKDEFEVIDWPKIFGVTTTPFAQAIDETFNDPTYSQVVLEF